MAFSGTAVPRGRSIAYVVATGEDSELGRIAQTVRTARDMETPLQRRVARLARVVGVVAGVSSVVVFGFGVIEGRTIADMFRLAVSLAVASVPEGLPVAFTITLAIGVRRMARRRAIVRQLGAVETLGSTTVIGSDKTGTLTENRMTVREIWSGGRTFTFERAGELAPTLTPGSPLHLTLLAGILAGEAELAKDTEGPQAVGDPTEAALLLAASALGLDVEEERAARPRRALVAFEPERRFSASVHHHEGEPTVFVAGAPERILAMCDRFFGEGGTGPLDTASVERAAGAMADRGLRVIAVAFGRIAREVDPIDEASRPRGLAFLGLEGMLDPPRPGVQEAIAGCRRAGLRVILITGDHPGTARSIGRELGIADANGVLTGVALEAMSDEDLVQRVNEVSIYARVSPVHKLRIVHALRSRGEVVAVTGDGVNDAPALKAADIGVAMGRGGTDVAREASDIVLADDNFVSIYAAVEEGRVTFDNLRKITYFLVSTGVAEVLAILAALALGWPLLLLPAQILWLNLVTEGLQDVALAFEPGEPDVLRRSPRPRTEPILSPLLWERTVIVAIVMAGGTLALFGWSFARSGSLAEAQSVALTTMVLFQTFQIGNARSEQRSALRIHPLSNRFLFASAFGALAVHAAALYWEPTQHLLGIEPIDLAAWPLMILVALTVVVAGEAHKAVRARRK